MSSFPTAPTSTTASSASCRFPDRPPVAVITCGALAGHIREIAARRGWLVELHVLPALLHNRPQKIPSHAKRLAQAALRNGQRVAVAYADCGTYGGLDEVCSELGLRRLPGLHCYDVLAGPGEMRAAFESEPGTYVLTDFLVRSFRRTVLAELGLDVRPQLWQDYFGHYRRLVWLAQDPEPGLAAQAEEVAAMFGLPLTVVTTGTSRLERELESLLHETGTLAVPGGDTAAARPGHPGADPAAAQAGRPSADPAAARPVWRALANAAESAGRS
jgi:hypothetical protein